jgi:hypothetical protein
METATAPTISKRREVMLFSLRSILTASLAIVVVLAAASAQAGTIVNGGFETGTTDGWTYWTAGDTQVSVVQGGAPEGNYYAHLYASAFALENREANVSFGSAAAFSASAGDVLTFDYRASTYVTGPNSGWAMIQATLSDGVGYYDVPLQLGTDWTTASVTLPASGEYSFNTYLHVEALVYDDGEHIEVGAANSQLDIDNFRIAPVPEPSTLLLAAVALLGLLAYAWRKCR